LEESPAVEDFRLVKSLLPALWDLESRT
jgi:hypothetical protein